MASSSLFLFLLVALSLYTATLAQNLPGAPYPSPPIERARFSPFRPSIAVVVGVLTTMFSVTFLLLLYAKHCKRNNPPVAGAGAGAGAHYPLHSSSTGGRKNSGVDRAVIESLPVFRFGSLSGQNKEGLECAVCLSRFESSEVLRLLPKCKHAFHVECVDTWLDAHSTCPLCRYRVDPEDILLIDVAAAPPPAREDNAPAPDVESGFFSRISGRHSSAGERVFQVIKETASFRRSLDRIGRVDRSSRKDGLLPLQCRERFEHRIIVSPRRGGGGGPQVKRWSDVQPSDLLYLRSEMIMFSSAARRHGKRQESSGGEGRSVINSRSVSEMTGVSRNDDVRQRQQAGLVSRWVAWLSQLGPPGGSDPNDP